MTQQVAIVIGIPILSAIATTQTSQMAGFRLALAFDVIVTLISVVFIWVALRPQEINCWRSKIDKGIKIFISKPTALL